MTSANTNERNTADAGKVITDYFVGDLSKASVLEIWRLSGGAVRQFLLTMLAKVMRQPVRVGVPVSRQRTERIAYDEIPRDIQRDLQPFQQSLFAAGFSQNFVSRVISSDTFKAYAIYHLSRDRMTMAAALWAQAGRVIKSHLGLTSRRKDGRVESTINAAPLLRVPPEIRVLNVKNASAETVIQRHLQRISGFMDLLPFSEAEASEFVDNSARRIIDYRAQCGLYVSATETELRQHGIIV